MNGKRLLPLTFWRRRWVATRTFWRIGMGISGPPEEA
jgi:hypothetical protein